MNKGFTQLIQVTISHTWQHSATFCLPWFGMYLFCFLFKILLFLEMESLFPGYITPLKYPRALVLRKLREWRPFFLGINSELHTLPPQEYTIPPPLTPLRPPPSTITPRKKMC